MKSNFANANYDSSYRICANFLNWVVEYHDKNFTRKLNAAAPRGPLFREDLERRNR